MYEEKDLNDVLRQRNRRLVCLGIPLAVLAIVIVAAALKRVEALTTGATIAAGVLIIAGYDLFIKPLNAYAAHVDNMLHGRKREIELPFAGISEDISLVDGVRYHAVTCADQDAKGKPCDRLFYFDAEKPFPGFEEGEMVHIVYHDKEVASISRA